MKYNPELILDEKVDTVSAWAHVLLDPSLSCTCTSPTQPEGSGFWEASGHVKEESPGPCCPLAWASPFLQCESDRLSGLSWVCRSPQLPWRKHHTRTQGGQVCPGPSQWGAQDNLHLMALNEKWAKEHCGQLGLNQRGDRKAAVWFATGEEGGCLSDLFTFTGKWQRPATYCFNRFPGCWQTFSRTWFFL